MAFAFTQDNINEITEFLFTEPMSVENSWIWQIHNKDSKQALVLTIHNSVAIGAGIEGSLISVQTHQGYYELHNCAAFMIFEPDEIIFISADKERVSSLIISRECTCSVYSNVA
ncbi:MAG: hypothetical protein QG635_334, partial [Bacteroidota bacterium]|nr:hypothetical protein [Bacteroidota bacterium]